ncbi:MAG TPA: SDR family oxidoreductase [Solirubrobacteraceae bacterium]|nr:SDR family oxidoreductase [Solirubrobacteraceae bacterium]
MELGFNGEVVLITGGSKGIGLASAKLFAAEGCNIAIAARDGDGVEAALAEIGAAGDGETFGTTGDMTSTEDVERVVAETLDRFGRIDVLVTCAGASPGGSLEDLDEEQWYSSLHLKLMGYVRACRAVLPHMRERGSGSVVLVVGNDGLKPIHFEVTAGAANAADQNFAAAIAEQYGKHGVRVNTVNPGPVDTDRWDLLEKAIAAGRGISQGEARKLVEASIPLGRICTAEEVADLVVFLASSRASFINGAHVPIDGAQRKALMDQP